MKRLTVILALLCLYFPGHAQENSDSVAVYDVFSRFSEKLRVKQSSELRSAVAAHIERNEKRTASGLNGQTFSIRIFFDSGQNARAASEAAAARFRNLHPGVPVSRTFTNPFFKVTVGNYSSRPEAANALKTIQQEFPAAFIVRN